MLALDEQARLTAACAELPIGRDYRERDYVTVLLTTVLDFQLQVEVLAAALAHYRRTLWRRIRTHKQLATLAGTFPDTRAGNLAFARALWGNNCWTRAQFLRALMSFFEGLRATDQTKLWRWLKTADFERDVRGKIRSQYHSVGPAIFHWLLLRMGFDTVKPDVHVTRFVQEVVGRRVRPQEIVDGVVQAARELDRRCFELDAAIWQEMRSSRSSTP